MIRENMVFIDETLNTQDEVIDFIIDATVKNGLAGNKEILKQAVMKREAEISTSVGHQIAIPHGKSETVQEPFVAYVSVKKPFVWDNTMNDEVRGIFLIGVPKEDAGMIHLQYIANVSKKLINDEFREKLFSCKEKKEAFFLLRSLNQ